MGPAAAGPAAAGEAVVASSATAIYEQGTPWVPSTGDGIFIVAAADVRPLLANGWIEVMAEIVANG
jgi:hypothetical protein